MNEYFVIGQMSGTSLDGVDLVYSSFRYDGDWSFKIIASETYVYSPGWRQILKNAPEMKAPELIELDRKYGCFLGSLINRFIHAKKINKVDFIGSHGHTVFHQPEKGFTYQIGHGANIAEETKIKTICDFRSTDVANGGQGAPLVPIGDKLLFSNYDYCLNIGGFANISFNESYKRIAFDICPANIVLNKLSNELGYLFDEDGNKAYGGSLNTNLFDELNDLEFYRLPPPKSLGKEWLDKVIMPVLEQNQALVEDKLHTFCKHIALQIAKVVDKQNSRMLITGGGAYNKTLINFIEEECKSEIIIPSEEIIDFKEALIFAFLAVLRNENKINCLKSVTGARSDSCCGSVYVANK